MFPRVPICAIKKVNRDTLDTLFALPEQKKSTFETTSQIKVI